MRGEKALFEPIKPGKVSLYVCGNTVYDHCHIGHARSMLVFDVITRYLRSQNWQVTYVRNITDIDDKIIKRAAERGCSAQELAESFIDAQNEDCAALNILPPDHEPKATEYVPSIIELIENLVSQDKAYVADNGDVCFSVTSFADYGKLSGRDIEKLISGARVDVDHGKRDPLDFVLWKLAKAGEPSWPSPWGEGRPGWHIECSAMAMSLLGKTFDLHGGGLDLKFPHHENEIAQSEAACGCEFARYWMHVGLVQVDKEKMSKSLGNFVVIREVLKQYPAEVLRYLMISSHYRSPVNYAENNMTLAAQALRRWYLALRDLPEAEAVGGDEFKQRFHAAMHDDFNTPVAFAALFDLAREINRLRQADDLQKAAQLAAVLKSLVNPLGLLLMEPEQFLQGDASEMDVSKIEALIQERNIARAAKNWQRADEIRDQLTKMGVTIDDSGDGTTWRQA